MLRIDDDGLATSLSRRIKGGVLPFLQRERLVASPRRRGGSEKPGRNLLGEEERRSKGRQKIRSRDNVKDDTVACVQTIPNTILH